MYDSEHVRCTGRAQKLSATVAAVIIIVILAYQQVQVMQSPATSHPETALSPASNLCPLPTGVLSLRRI